MTDQVTADLTVAIDGFSVPIVRPALEAEVQTLVVQARHRGEAIYPVGGGTVLDLGLPPSKPGIAVSMRALSQIIDYPARDMTVTVQAGISLEDLQQLLATENQRLPIDVPRPGLATLGGALAANVSGPRRLGFGSLRDYVLGIGVINDEGQRVKAGGRVVKNVAGYDLCKLFIGSLGTLGIISEATLKVVPCPEESALVILYTPAARFSELLGRLHESTSRPCCVEVLNASAIQFIDHWRGLNLGRSDFVVVAGFEGNRDAVTWQVQQLVRELRGDFLPEVRMGSNAIPVWDALTETFPAGSFRVALQICVRPSQCADFVVALSAQSEQPLIQAHAGDGKVQAYLAAELSQVQVTDLVGRARGLVAGEPGFLVVRRCPSDWKTAEFVWGRPRDDVRLMRKIKEKLDPNRIFNPGRFVDGF